MKNNVNQLHSSHVAIPFNSALIGQSLREVSSSILNTNNEVFESRWFHSDIDADLFIWFDKNSKIIKQQLTFFGQVIEWSLSEGLKTGLIIEDEVSQKIKSSPLIQYDVRVQLHAVVQAVDIIDHVSGLSLEYKRKLIENLSSQIATAPTEKVKTSGSDSSRETQDTFLKKMMSSVSNFIKKILRF